MSNQDDMKKTDASISQLEKLTKKKKQIEAQIAKLKTQEKKKERKEDTRRKIILGGFLMAQIEKDEEAKRIFKACVNSLTKEHDKKLFQDIK